MEIDLKHAKHAVGQSAYHFVWRPKSNISVFRSDFARVVMENALLEVAAKHKINIIEMKVMPDHIHLFADVPPTVSVSKALQYLKGGSARIFFKKCTIWHSFFSKRGTIKPHLWSPGKFFRSVGCVTAEVVEKYIRDSQEGWSANGWDK